MKYRMVLGIWFALIEFMKIYKLSVFILVISLFFSVRSWAISNEEQALVEAMHRVEKSLRDDPFASDKARRDARLLTAYIHDAKVKHDIAQATSLSYKLNSMGFFSKAFGNETIARRLISELARGGSNSKSVVAALVSIGIASGTAFLSPATNAEASEATTRTEKAVEVGFGEWGLAAYRWSETKTEKVLDWFSSKSAD